MAQVKLLIQSAALGLVLASPAFAQGTCDAALQTLQAASSTQDPAQILQAWSAVPAAGCEDFKFNAARSQVSGLLARAASAALEKGDVNGAEEIVLQAPGVHWAVQAVRGDIAAKRGDRVEASKQYNAALDTLGDPGQTVQSEALVPVAERLLSLAQENMMLAGSMARTVTRGGGAAGVMAVAARGLAVEKKAAEPAPAATPYVAPAAAPAADATYQAPAAAAPAYVPPADAPTYQAPAAAQVYADAPAAPAYVPPPAEYNVITAAATKVDSVFLPIRFGFDSDQLDPTGVREALRLVDFLNANQVGTLTITGHTDDVGSESYNLDLSLRRAQSLAAFIQSGNVHAQIFVVGKGESQPPVFTTTYSLDEQRTIARRVEVSFGY